jgi:polysaccharide biosynthesis/export protein
MKLINTVWAAIFATPLLISGAAQAQDGYLVRKGDVLRVEVLEDSNLNRSALVAPDGRITVPLAGSIQASGRSLDQVRTELTEKIASKFAATPNVYISIDKLAEPVARTGVARTLNIYVIGEAANPGKVAITSRTTLLQAFAEMGGFSKFAATKRIQLRRTDRKSGAEKVYAIDYDAIMRGESANANVRLMDGDVILIPQRKLFE